MLSYSTIRYFHRIFNRDSSLINIKRFFSISLRNESSNVEQVLETSRNTKLLKIAIIGAPNAGKSTLINQIVKRRVFPISKKVHTTRHKAKAVVVENDTQLVFLDTPGLVTPTEVQKYKLTKDFVLGGEKAIREADVIGVVHDLSNPYLKSKLNPLVLRLLHTHYDKESFLILNKIDTMKSKRNLLDISKYLTGGQLNRYEPKDRVKLPEEIINETIEKEPFWRNFSDIFMVSALLGEGTDDLKKYLLNGAYPSEWMFPEDSFTDQKPIQIIEETVRAVLLDNLTDEIPYKMDVELEYFDIEKSGRVVAVALVGCQVARHQRLIKGPKGQRIMEIAAEAEQKLREIFLEDVKLLIIVKDTLSKPVKTF